MIKRIELWDFESHEHTVLDDISPALNLLCGESNSGKTSIIRALKLAAYNEFDPRSVRVGATKCVVQVDTERGRVKVTRGTKDNLWEITRNGQKPQYFDKVGVHIVPEAEEIIGLKIVTLGDVEVPVNIMDQLESHFMLAEVGGKDASGSMRAQIVDEISGLSGIEGLIKDVSLDHHRFGREIKETEKAMEEVRAQLHPEADLKVEAGILEKAEKELTDQKTMLGLAVEGESLISNEAAIRQKLVALERDLQAIPDTDVALAEIEKASAKSDRAATAEDLYLRWVVADSRLERIGKELVGMPDCQAASGFINEAEAKARVLAKIEEVLGRWRKADQDLKAKQKRLQEIGDVPAAQVEIAMAQSLIVRQTEAEEMLRLSKRLSVSILGMQQKLEENDRALKAAEKERDAILASVTTCPLTLKPVSKECLA